MTNSSMTTSTPSPLWQYWRGLSGWNFYFLLKFGLLWAGYLNFHPLLNLVFMAFLLMPLPRMRLHRLRHWIALPIGFGLFWHDTWLPGPESILSQGSQVAGFSADYLLDLVTRFINWQMIGGVFVLLVAWLFLSQWIRVTVFVVAIMIWLNVLTLTGPAFNLWPGGQPTTTVTTTGGGAAATVAAAGDTPVVGDMPAQTAPPTSENLNAYLASFYASEEKRQSTFPAQLPADAQPFDLLVINICSLSWDDIEAAGLMSHPLWSHFDIVFKHFNSATAYSGPAAIRLLRASCGQSSHKNLYQQANNQCYLFDNLAKLGFTQQLMMDHNGEFGGFLKEIRDNGGVQVPLMDQSGLPPVLLSFDGSPVYDDTAVLNRWMESDSFKQGQRTATFYNLLPLHDGNHYPGDRKTADYKLRAQKLFDELDAFFTQLEKSGRKVMVVLVPEHGAALKGDKMQVSGLRDIPSPSITNVPTAIKFFGMKAPHQGAPIEINQPSSFLAISELVTRVLDGKIFTEDSVNWQQLTSNLPQTAPVSENANAIVLQYQNKPYVRLNGGDWVPYPQ
ncbi:UNVERIFIED_ORG: cellulose synthase operon protein YhjU [Kosakonia oryzae]|uniref:Cellulose synthase operon protein YhjU n=1 Tax=Kosakonia radicincitans TaxID=283686 RepID=A0AAX2EUE7_9ENTR|nr:cellulose biosynthesis protein BcsG [Kosakonia radicincitans]MDP9567709.1 cellulose synthase operon protein YhjU [Kosakonia oryzae]SFE97561.1 cellulose synthase operon protein YhjU [Kosakonia radicincitans]SFR18930.1 cellulose synthase operon protein YhjU [Kosakonia radicincitans]SFT82775.1 cellulose synthase operon protein YhjU [Kosakonia radicincitans]SFX68531.1 cellulose synthase operon protein YhjU [Kosakonia radicincitans]